MLLALKSSRRFCFAFVSKRCRSQSLKSSLCVAGGTERVYVMHQLVNGRKGKKLWIGIESAENTWKNIQSFICELHMNNLQHMNNPLS